MIGDESLLVPTPDLLVKILDVGAVSKKLKLVMSVFLSRVDPSFWHFSFFKSVYYLQQNCQARESPELRLFVG